jgi:hypothetical protein
METALTFRALRTVFADIANGLAYLHSIEIFGINLSAETVLCKFCGIWRGKIGGVRRRRIKECDDHNAIRVAAPEVLLDLDFDPSCDTFAAVLLFTYYLIDGSEFSELPRAREESFSVDTSLARKTISALTIERAEAEIIAELLHTLEPTTDIDERMTSRELAQLLSPEAPASSRQPSMISHEAMLRSVSRAWRMLRNPRGVLASTNTRTSLVLAHNPRTACCRLWMRV